MTPDHDVVIVGDGPAGAALAAACVDAGLDTCVIGPGRPWTNTYAGWVDDTPRLPSAVYGTVSEQVIVGGVSLRRLDRPYGVFDNYALRAHLGLDELLTVDTMTSVGDRGGSALIGLASGGTLSGRLVVDATGAGDPPRAWQTAYGVVVDAAAAAEVATTDAVTLMDWSWSGSTPSFLHVVPVANDWLVEHTVLAASPAVEPAALRATLVDRLGAATVTAAEAAGRTESVRIPMGLPVRCGAGAVARFGAAAGMIHPATGYSVTAALRAAPRIAAAITAGDDVHEAIWPAGARRTRALHDFGLDALLRLDAVTTERFFDAFFDLPADRWADHLRIDTAPQAVAAAMGEMFRRAPWSVRRRLVGGNPFGLVRLARSVGFPGRR